MKERSENDKKRVYCFQCQECDGDEHHAPAQWRCRAVLSPQTGKPGGAVCAVKNTNAECEDYKAKIA